MAKPKPKANPEESRKLPTRPGRNGGRLNTGGNHGGGRPPKIPSLDKYLAEILEERKDGIDGLKAVLLALRNKAIKGDVRAIEALLDRAFGKPKQSMDLSNSDGTFIRPSIIVPELVKPEKKAKE